MRWRIHARHATPDKPDLQAIEAPPQPPGRDVLLLRTQVRSDTAEPEVVVAGAFFGAQLRQRPIDRRALRQPGPAGLIANTSALLAPLYREPDAARYEQSIATTPNCRMSVACARFRRYRPRWRLWRGPWLGTGFTGKRCQISQSRAANTGSVDWQHDA